MRGTIMQLFRLLEFCKNLRILVINFEVECPEQAKGGKDNFKVIFQMCCKLYTYQAWMEVLPRLPLSHVFLRSSSV